MKPSKVTVMNKESVVRCDGGAAERSYCDCTRDAPVRAVHVIR